MEDTYTMHTVEIFDAKGNLTQRATLPSLAEIQSWAGKNKSARISTEVLPFMFKRVENKTEG